MERKGVQSGWRGIFLVSFALLTALAPIRSQCVYPIDTIDEFDSTRLIVFKPVSIGYMIPSQVETANGPLMIEEAKLMFTFTQNDSIDAFLLTIAVPEWDYQPIDTDFNVWLRLSNEQVINLLNFPDRGTFDPKTNMRVYQHTCIVPVDLFYNLTHHTVEKIRILYRNKKRTLILFPEQQAALRDAVRCIGEAVGLFPLKP